MTTTPVIDLMGTLRSGNSTAPRLTWYGPDAERVELSGRVLDNWVAKTSNLLQDELDAEPEPRPRFGVQLVLEQVAGLGHPVVQHPAGEFHPFGVGSVPGQPRGGGLARTQGRHQFDCRDAHAFILPRASRRDLRHGLSAGRWGSAAPRWRADAENRRKR